MIKHTIHFSNVFGVLVNRITEAKPTHIIFDDPESKRIAKKEAEQHLIEEATIDNE